MRAHVQTLPLICLSVSFIAHKSTLERTMTEIKAFDLKLTNFGLWYRDVKQPPMGRPKL